MKSDKEKQEQFMRIYREYKNDIYKVAMHYTKDYDVAQEVTQAAFYKLYLGFDGVRLETVRALLICMVKNVISNHFRDIKHDAPGEFLDVVDESGLANPNVEDEYIETEERIQKTELCNGILECLREDHPSWCEALIQVYYVERPQAEVAKELDISLEVLHSRLYRARQWIRKNYQKEYDEIIGWN